MTTTPPSNDYSGELLSSSVRRLLLERIMTGEYEPGARIVELQLSRELGVSQSPIREALRDLAAIGIVAIHPRRGASVRRPSARELADVSVVRSEIDALGARLASKLILESTLEILEGLIQQMISAFHSGDFLAVTEADVQFHRLIVVSTENHALARAFDQLAPFGRTFITLTLPDVDVMGIILEHQEILHALRERDPDKAADRARLHQMNVSELLVEHYPPDASPVEVAPRK